ncbi:MAG: hypothetical protein JWQ35_2244 [Bacteriovoracaceae bacterium]|nr:hypothetical protein [Bacteriovoracaceae bacterium]
MVDQKSSATVDFSALDLIRGAAATYVVINHSRGYLFIGGEKLHSLMPAGSWPRLEALELAALQLTRVGTEIVILFFVLSGFCIAHSLKHTESLKGFYLRRLVRLYPPYLGGLLWAMLVFLLIKNIRPDFFSGVYDFKVFKDFAISQNFLSWKNILKNIFYMPDGVFIFQYWSLTYEIIFYALAPLFLLHLRSYYVFSLITYLFGWWIDGSSPGKSSYITKFWLTYNIYFAVGILAYSRWAWLKKKILMKRMAFFLVSMALFLSMISINFYRGGFNKYSAIFATILCLVLMVNFQTHSLKGALWKFLGAASYSIYVSHVASILLLLTLLYQFTPLVPPYITSKLIWLLGPVFALSFAWIFYQLFEAPTKSILKQLRTAERESMVPHDSLSQI